MALDPLGQELQVIVSHPVGAGNGPSSWSSGCSKGIVIRL